MSPFRALICLALTHTLVDTCAMLVAPLWDDIENKFQLGITGLVVAFAVQSLPTSVSQIFFGYWRDRFDLSLWLIIGPLIAALLLPLMGVASNLWVLYSLFIIGGIGVGSFHPEAAVAAGQIIPNHRARGLSIFMVGGSLGLALAPTLSGLVVDQFGGVGLIFLTPPLILGIILLRKIGRLNELKKADISQKQRPTFSEMFDHRLGVALLILIVCSLRLVPNMAVDKVLSFALSSKGYSKSIIGMYQSTFIIAGSVGTLLMATWFRHGWEKPFLIACPLVGIPLLAILGIESLPQPLFLGTLATLGLVLWGTTPAMISYAQQLFPRGAGLASALTMGLSWGVGGLIQAPITSYYKVQADQPLSAFYGFIPCLMISVVGACFLPALPDHQKEASKENK